VATQIRKAKLKDMKFIVSTNSLLKHLQSVQGVINSSSVLPILDNFLFEIEDKNLTICTTDLNTTMKTSLPIEGKGKAKIAVPSKILLETLKSLPDQPITFSFDDNTFAIEINTDKGKYKLSGENGEDFPAIPEVSRTSSFSMPASALLSAVTNTLFAVGTDELRQAMTGVKFELDTNSINFVATDAHKLVLHTIKKIAIEETGGFIVPRKALNLLKSALPGDDTLVTVDHNSTNVFFSFKEIHLVCRLIDQKYPDYTAVIPKDNTNILTINRAEFLNTLRRISIYSNKTTFQVRLKIKGSELQVSAEDLDFSNQADETLACEYSGNDMEIGFNARFLIEMLNTLGGTTVRFEMSLPSRPGVMLPTDQEPNEETLMLIMPVMLNTYE
jgi:DNA polymerase-3 subunit beta